MTTHHSPTALAHLTKTATLRTYDIGDHRLTWLPDGVAYLEPRAWLPGAPDELWRQHRELINDDGYLVASIGALLIEYADRALLIDAGFGPLATRTPFGLIRGGELLRSLAAAGKHPDDFEAIALTHLHLDHIGWLRHTPAGPGTGPLSGRPILVSETEWRYRHLTAIDGVAPDICESFTLDIRTIAHGDEIFPGIQATATPGHSLGHLAYTITTSAERIIVFGDALQTPLQITHPELTSAVDDDPDAARSTARRLVDELSVAGTLGFGMHFADAQLGQVATTEDGTPIWQPTSSAA
ncbi:MBL fold metallo-hydrolase [Nocardia cyriacigeorgica]|uniref:MBL fold metallo-hydrolase n=1 Tax=Nocardia cyriacigeorgica TaxID=135487 RepID=UPI000CEB62DA|nr:MBL fold metallo-hydrolase [Nocardia cyriacigeorgica]AVH20315.1 MBL fold metallo-hydrolase [Nocardia cyriacigeorgica]